MSAQTGQIPLELLEHKADRADQRLRQRLLWRIHRRYQTAVQILYLGNLRIPFTRVADPDRVLDEVAAEEDRREKLCGRRPGSDELRLPYWAELWDSALGLGHYLARNPCNGPVLDLGCGMGLAGTVAAATGASVLLADIEPAALLFASLNSLPWRSRVKIRRVDWRTDRLGMRFQCILGADILYERAEWPCLQRFWRCHLAAGGRVLLAEPGRQTGDLFAAWIVGQGWQLQQSEQPVEARHRPIRIFQLRSSGDS